MIKYFINLEIIVVLPNILFDQFWDQDVRSSVHEIFSFGFTGH